MVRATVGGELPIAPFRLRGGFLVPPWFTFPQAPLRSRTVGFPESGSELGLSPGSLPRNGEAQVLAHIHPARCAFAPGLALGNKDTAWIRHSVRRWRSITHGYSKITCVGAQRDSLPRCGSSLLLAVSGFVHVAGTSQIIQDYQQRIVFSIGVDAQCLLLERRVVAPLR